MARPTGMEPETAGPEVCLTLNANQRLALKPFPGLDLRLGLDRHQGSARLQATLMLPRSERLRQRSAELAAIAHGWAAGWVAARKASHPSAAPRPRAAAGPDRHSAPELW